MGVLARWRATSLAACVARNRLSRSLRRARLASGHFVPELIRAGTWEGDSEHQPLGLKIGEFAPSASRDLSRSDKNQNLLVFGSFIVEAYWPISRPSSGSDYRVRRRNR